MATGPVVRGGFLAGVAIGAVAVLLGPQLVRAARPYAKSALKNGMQAYQNAQEIAARAGEEVEDLLAEIAHEKAVEEWVEKADGKAEETVADLQAKG